VGWDIKWLLQIFVFCEVDLVLYSLISIYTLQWSPHTKYKLSKQVPRVVNSACSLSPSQDSTKQSATKCVGSRSDHFGVQI
jgi:hypothetical protein